MLASKCWNSIETRSLLMDKVDYRSVMLHVALVEVQPLSCEYGIGVNNNYCADYFVLRTSLLLV